VRVEDRQGEFSTTDLEGRIALTVVPGTSPDVEVRGAAQTSAFQTVFLVQPGVAAGTHDLVLRFAVGLYRRPPRTSTSRSGSRAVLGLAPEVLRILHAR
jgi:hypothetical protein